MRIQKHCVVCGKLFDIDIDDKTRKILTKDVFHGQNIRLGIGMWSKYKWEGLNPDGSVKLVRVHPWYRELWYELIDLKRRIFHQYKDVEYWECPKCNRKGMKNASKKSRKSKGLVVNRQH